jgi:hypothetical protein
VSITNFSLLVRCQRDNTSDATLLQVVRVDNAEVVPLKEGHFLLRITSYEKGTVVRCLIRHLSSGHEVHIQSGARFISFIQDFLFDINDKP